MYIMIIKKENKTKNSIRSQIIALPRGGQIIFRGVHEGTLRNSCSTIASKLSYENLHQYSPRRRAALGSVYY